MNTKYLIVLLIFLSSCEFYLSGSYNAGIQRPPSNTNISLSFIPNADTLYIFNTDTLIFELDTKQYKLKSLSFYIGLSGISYGSNKLIINPENYAYGLSYLDARIITSANNGSLADFYGFEQLETIRRFCLFLDSRKVENFQITFEKTPEGYITLHWPACHYFNFKSYTIVGADFSREFTNYQTTSFTDSTFRGTSKYSITINVHTRNASATSTIEIPAE